MIHFTISARSLEEARQKIRESGIMGDEPTLIMPTIEMQPEATQPEATQPDVTPTEPVKTFKLEEVRAAANAYRDKHGIEKLREIFSKYGGEKLKDIPAWNYAALMEEIA